MAVESLEDKINQAGGAVGMLRSAHAGAHPFPVQPQFTTWQDEQKSWHETAVLFEQRHMTDVYFEGPGVGRLLSDVAVNSFATFGPMKAKQLLVCNEEGQYIGDAILFGLGEEKVSLVGGPVAANWVSFQAERGGYDVAISRDESALVNAGERLVFRYQVQGPRALDIVSAAHGAPFPQIKFFNIGAFDIAGTRVHALNHTMTGIPGEEKTGLEIWGPAESGPRVLEALLAAGEQYGLRQGGAIAYSTTALESGWLGLPVPGIYAGDATKAYREWLPAQGFEASASLGGSFTSDDINDYVPTPYDLGYANIIKFDHDFIGADALLAGSRQDPTAARSGCDGTARTSPGSSATRCTRPNWTGPGTCRSRTPSTPPSSTTRSCTPAGWPGSPTAPATPSTSVPGPPCA